MTGDMAIPLQDSAGIWKTRYTMALLCLLGLAISLATRVNLSVAIVDMVNETAVRERDSNSSVTVFFDPDACPGELELRGPGGRKDGEFVWDKQKQGEILAAYYYGYTAGHVPGGLLADYYGGKIIFAIGILVSSLLSILTPASAWAGDYVLFANRVIQGLVQGGIVPAIQTLICRWAPDHERSKFSIIFLGLYGGMMVSMAVTGTLCETVVGWPLTFYTFGALGLLWCVPWYLLVGDSPAQHPRIDPVERRYIEANIQSSVKQKLPVPWRSVLSTPAVWALITYNMIFDVYFYLLLSSLPLYIADILHFNMETNGLLSAVPHITAAAGNLFFGWFTDFVFRKGYLSKITGFRLTNGIAVLVPAATLVVVALVGCDTTTIIVMLALGGFCMAAHCSGFYMNMQAVAPNYAGTLVGFVNTFANIVGIIIPYVVGGLTNANPTRATWNTIFYVSAALLAAGYSLYAIFTTAEEQPWNVPPSEKGASVKQEKGVDNAAFDGGNSRVSGHTATCP